MAVKDGAKHTFLLMTSEGKFSTIDSHTDIPNASVADKRAPKTHVQIFSDPNIQPDSCVWTAHTVRYE